MEHRIYNEKKKKRGWQFLQSILTAVFHYVTEWKKKTKNKTRSLAPSPSVGQSVEFVKKEEEEIVESRRLNFSFHN